MFYYIEQYAHNKNDEFTTMNKIDAMQMFVSVVESGSISAAATRLNTVKSAVSKRISDLETHLGTQLLIRTTRKQTLTPTGVAYFEECKRIINDIEEVESSIAQEKTLLKGRLKIASPVSFGIHHLTPLINSFMCDHQQIECDIDFNDRRVDLIRDGIDVAIRIGRLEDSNLIAKQLCPIRFLVCASPEYLKRKGTPQTPKDLSNHKVLQYSLLPESNWQYRYKNGTKGSVKVPTKVLANNGDFIKATAIAGHGIIMEPTFIIYDAIEKGLLQPILTDYKWTGFSAYAIYPHTRHLSLKVRAFIDYLSAELSGEPWWDRNIGEFLSIHRQV